MSDSGVATTNPVSANLDCSPNSFEIHQASQRGQEPLQKTIGRSRSVYRLWEGIFFPLHFNRGFDTCSLPFSLHGGAALAACCPLSCPTRAQLEEVVLILHYRSIHELSASDSSDWK